MPDDQVGVRSALASAAARLTAVSDTPRLDAELLMAHALGTSREALLLGQLDGRCPPQFERLVERRLAHEPVAYITGRRAFWTIELAVSPAVLIPRPDSETLIEAAVEHFTGTSGPARLLDLGTGSGALLLAALAEWPLATGIGVDRSDAALDVAQRNAEALALAERAIFRHGDWDEGVDERFDLILCNPPYIATTAALPAEVVKHEPATALFAGEDGLDDHRRLATRIGRLLASGGLGVVEIGSDQGERAAMLYAAAGLSVSLRHDLAGLPRCLELRLP